MTTQNLPHQLLNAIIEASEQIINARDFCGDENEAAREALIEYGYQPTPERIAKAFSEADRQWNLFRKRAGVSKAS